MITVGAVIALNRFRVAPPDVASFRTRAEAAVSFFRGRPGCLAADLAQNLDDTARRFADRAALLECGPDGDPATGRTWTNG